MPRPKGSRDIAPKVRFQILKALDNLQAHTGKEPYEHIIEEMVEHGVAPTLQKLQGFIPKEQNIEVNQNTTVTLDPSNLDADTMREVFAARRAGLIRPSTDVH